MNIQKLYILTITILVSYVSFSQQEKKREQIDTVLITSSRIDLPFDKDSRTITVISSAQIAKSATTNVAELLQQVAGIDMRRRGTVGMQADLYIRGGGFDQTLLLIDGIKVEDPQTGHHTMNMALPLEVIERIEIIKGPAARVFGQNAFTGAINIVTKKNANNVTALGAKYGSYNQLNLNGTFGKDFGNTSIIAHSSYNSSDGYRFNTDYKNHNQFIKATFNKNSTPISVTGFFTERKFGANGFYASPKFTEQYEETQSSLVGVASTYRKGNLVLKPRLYWKRNQDMYLFKRTKPEFFRNFHISNKVGAELNMSYNSKMGTTGLGLDLAKVYLSSNNLGQRDRIMANLFLEHRFSIANDKLDITPGVAVNYFSDFKFHAFPGIDFGYQLNDVFKLYANAGYTYRIPTYTDLYYNSRTTIGNDKLNPESAISEEIGIKYNNQRVSASFVFFNRNSNDLIDYVKENENDKWQATNIQKMSSSGFEINTSTNFKVNNFNQNLSFGYTYLNEELEELKSKFSRYAINSLKHQLTTTYRSQFVKNLSQTLVFKCAERNRGGSYCVVDAMAAYTIKKFEVSVIANNIFNTEYTETNLVPMPKGNILVGLKYKF